MAGGEGGNHDVGHVHLLEGRGGEKQRDEITTAGHCRQVPSPCPAPGGDTSLAQEGAAITQHGKGDTGRCPLPLPGSVAAAG